MTVLGPSCGKSVRSHTDSAWGGVGRGDTIGGGVVVGGGGRRTENRDHIYIYTHTHTLGYVVYDVTMCIYIVFIAAYLACCCGLAALCFIQQKYAKCFIAFHIHTYVYTYIYMYVTF